ncbi:1-deoxy-D-xylulose-5-phosphate synthase [Planctomycetota bacterium]
MSKLLEQINSPADVKKLSIEQLNILADEIRQFILGSVSETGGHLASNLGVVELTLALHYVFDFKSDKLLWDVGHQCYTHKIITGRRENFGKLRQVDGPSGFPNPAESEYDQFVVGHAGTSIATAIGLALGQVQTRKSDKVVALVGDASIVNGLSFEALNNLGLVKRQLLIVLNDNSMAIDSTVGAVAKYFSKIRLSHTYEDLREKASNILEHLPVIGKPVEGAIERIKKGIRMALPGSQMFESLNIPYFGPVDGHDVGSLVQLFNAIAHLEYPAILHVYTKKGKGFSPADGDPRRFHSTGPFKVNGDMVEPKVKTASRSYTDVFGDALVELAQKDERIVAITSAMCDGTGLSGFRERFPDRFYDVGIAESIAVDVAAGLAKSGLRPVVCIYSTFLQRSFDQIFQEVALQNLGVVFCIDRAGMVGSDGITHHGLMDIGFMRMMENVVVAAPGCGCEMKSALEFAVGSGRCVCLRYPKETVPEDAKLIEACSKRFELGKSVLVKKGVGSKIAIVSYGAVLPIGIEAVERLCAEGIEVDLVNARFASPVDEEIISLLASGKSIITLEDHRLSCGFGSAVLERAAGCVGAGNIFIVGVRTSLVRQDLRKNQLIKSSVSADKIVELVRKIVNDK